MDVRFCGVRLGDGATAADVFCSIAFRSRNDRDSA
jgi:hypothetical protein